MRVSRGKPRFHSANDIIKTVNGQKYTQEMLHKTASNYFSEQRGKLCTIRDRGNQYSEFGPATGVEGSDSNNRGKILITFLSRELGYLFG